jgi:hypothetical protein
MLSWKRPITSSLSSLALWFMGSCRNSSVNRRHSWTFSGETKSTATFVHDCAGDIRIISIIQENFFGKKDNAT